jgi:hypothetical protein
MRRKPRKHVRDEQVPHRDERRSFEGEQDEEDERVARGQPLVAVDAAAHGRIQAV